MSGSIPFIDLHAQRDRIRADLDRRIAAVLDHGRFILGPEVAELEADLAGRGQVEQVVGCASGTDALQLALMALGAGRGDAVIVPSFTFVATAEAVVLTGAVPVFVDVDADTFCLDPGQIGAGLVAARDAGLRPVGVIPVDMFGHPADHDAVAAEAEAARLWVVADIAQSFGAVRRGAPSAARGRMAATSFFPAKPLGCYGDGGAVFATAEDAAVLRSLRVHGQGTDKYDNVRVGLNSRLDTVQAAVLLAKLAVFDDELDRRQVVARRYHEGLVGVCDLPPFDDDTRPAWAQYTIRTPSRDHLAEHLRAAGVPTMVYYGRSLHQQPAYERHPVAGGRLPVSERLGDEVLSLPMHPYLEPDVQDRIISAVREFLR